jgi:hypothetical protein
LKKDISFFLNSLLVSGFGLQFNEWFKSRRRIVMKKQMALVRVFSYTGPAMAGTFYGDFLLRLEERVPHFPVREVLIAGFYILMQKMGKELKHEITPQSIQNTFSSLVNWYVTAGMAYKYTTPTRAAEAFVAQVVPAIKKGIAEMQPGMATSLQEVAQKPAAQFFAQLMKELKEWGEQLNGLCGRYAERNLAKRGDLHINEVAYQNEPHSKDDHFTSLGTVFDFRKGYEKSITKEDPVVMVSRLKELDQAIQRSLKKTLALWRKVPQHVRLFPDDVTVMGSIDREWLHTQLLLEVIGVRDREFIMASELGRAINAVRCTSNAVLVEQCLTRLSRSGVTYTENEQSFLRSHIEAEVKFHQSHAWTREPSPAQFVYVVYLQFDADVLITRDLSQEELLLIAKDRREEVGVDVGITGDRDTQLERLLAELPGRINWPKCTAQDVQEILKARVIPYGEVVKGVASMPEKNRAQAARYLITPKHQDRGGKSHRLLLHYGLVPADWEVLEKYVSTLSPKEAEQCLRSFLEMAGDVGTQGDLGLSEEKFRTIARIVSSERLSDILATPRAWTEVAFRYVMPFLGMVTDRTKKVDVLAWRDALRVFFTKETWIMIVLHAYAIRRFGEYDDCRTGRSCEFDAPPWEKVYETVNGVEKVKQVALHDILGTSLEEAKRIIQSMTEEDACVVIGDEARVVAEKADFTKAKEAYFAAKEQSKGKKKKSK